jgi:hypothetical protein
MFKRILSNIQFKVVDHSSHLVCNNIAPRFFTAIFYYDKMQSSVFHEVGLRFGKLSASLGFRLRRINFSPRSSKKAKDRIR